MSWLKIICLVPILFFGAQSIAQNKSLDKANKRFQIKKYAEAIPLYEEGLLKSPNLRSKSRLAYCYRMNNKIDEALKLYEEIVQNPKVRSRNWYYYGETLVSHGRYDEAKIWLDKYLIEKPKDAKSLALMESIKKIQNIRPYFRTNNLQAYAHNSEGDDSAPVFFRDGVAFSSDRKSGMKVMKKKSTWTGREFLSLYFSERKEDGTYAAPDQMSRRLNDINKNTGTIAVSPDGSYVVFSRNSDVSNRMDQYNLMLYRADISKSGKFKNVKMLSFCKNNINYMHPAFAPDGETLYFTTDRKGEGGTDIFYSEMGSKGWKAPKNVGTPINTASNEGFPFVDAEGKLYFCSKGHLSFGGFDILFSQKDENGNWGNPINLGQPINSASDDISIYINSETTIGMFASSREGGDDDIYFFDIEGINDWETEVPPSLETPVATKMEEESTSIPENEATVLVENELEETALETETAELSATNIEVEEELEIVTEVTAVEETTMVVPPVVEEINEEVVAEEMEETVFTTTEFSTEKVVEEVIVAEEMNIVTPPVVEEVVEEIVEEKLPAATEVPTEKVAEEIVFEIEMGSTSTATKFVYENVEQNTEVETESTDEPTPIYTQPTKTEIDTPSLDLPIGKEEIILDAPVQEEVSKFEDGLANLDTPMTEEVPLTKPTGTNNNLEELKDFLSNESPQADATFNLEKIKFNPKAYVVNKENAAYLDKLVRMMNEVPEVKIEVNAHTESPGDDRENMVLSIKRATAVAGYLIRHGIATDRIKVMGYGETQLLNHCSNGVECSFDEHQLNQRVELKILK